jgi:adenylylsulfate kinase|tara:strand:+ start:478 stop:1086 length:609 start_codon:yes stop_codon:yes gene_type:complete
MNDRHNNIFPVFDNILSKENKEKQLNQKAKVIWMTGLSGSGKTTIAIEVEKRLYKKGYLAQILDGDNIRVGISSNLSFSNKDRLENIRRISEVSKLFINCGIITINCFVSPSNIIRQQAKKIIGMENFIGVFINSDLGTCEKRDTKGLYKKARKGEIDNFTGVSSEFEIPDESYININTSNLSIEKSVNQLMEAIIPKIQFK